MQKTKIKSPAELVKITSVLKKQGKKIVFTNGCFDIIHFGHVAYLEQARKMGDILIVALNSDASVRRLKGPSRPLNPQNERAGVIAGLESVDYVTIFGQSTPLAVIKKIRPDILVKGADWKSGHIVGEEVLKEYGGKVFRAKFLSGLSTTKLIEKIVKTTNIKK